MKLNTFFARTPVYYAQQASVCLRGPVGRGKTTVMKKVPELLSTVFPGKRFGFVLINGPLLNPPDAIGYLMPHNVERVGRDGAISKHLESLFTEPFWFRTEEGEHISDFDGGIIFVDEEDKMDADVKKIIGEAALSRRLGPHVLPPGWIVWFAGNRQEDRSGSTKDYAHLQNRRRDINIDDDIDSVVEYYNKAGLNPLFCAFAANNSEVVFEKIPENIGAWCTPRSLERTARHVMAVMESTNVDPMSEEIPTDPLLQEEVAGDIGAGAAAQLWATIELQKHMPRFADIIAKPDKVEVPPAADAQMLVTYNLASRADAKNIAAVMKYLERFPEEFRITFAKAAVARNFSLINTPAFGEWTKRNSSLMMAISDAR